jgi:hypothetical protein
VSHDVLAIRLDDYSVRFLAENENADDAEAIMNFAIIRRGLDEEFYAIRPHGEYKAGEKFGTKGTDHAER